MGCLPAVSMLGYHCSSHSGIIGLRFLCPSHAQPDAHFGLSHCRPIPRFPLRSGFFTMYNSLDCWYFVQVGPAHGLFYLASLVLGFRESASWCSRYGVVIHHPARWAFIYTCELRSKSFRHRTAHYWHSCESGISHMWT